VTPDRVVVRRRFTGRYGHRYSRSLQALTPPSRQAAAPCRCPAAAAAPFLLLACRYRGDPVRELHPAKRPTGTVSPLARCLFRGRSPRSLRPLARRLSRGRPPWPLSPLARRLFRGRFPWSLCPLARPPRNVATLAARRATSLVSRPISPNNRRRRRPRSIRGRDHPDQWGRHRPRSFCGRDHPEPWGRHRPRSIRGRRLQAPPAAAPSPSRAAASGRRHSCRRRPGPAAAALLATAGRALAGLVRS
jgi:hypothetical protein